MATATTTTATGSTTTVTYSNSSTATDDYFVVSADCLAAQWNVMANDGGGKNTSLWSVDDGYSALKPTGGITFDMDLLAQDALGSNQSTSGGVDKLAGGFVRIDSYTGLVTYHVDAGTALYNRVRSLRADQYYEDTFV